MSNEKREQKPPKKKVFCFRPLFPPVCGEEFILMDAITPIGLTASYHNSSIGFSAYGELTRDRAELILKWEF